MNPQEEKYVAKYVYSSFHYAMQLTTYINTFYSYVQHVFLSCTTGTKEINLLEQDQPALPRHQ